MKLALLHVRAGAAALGVDLSQAALQRIERYIRQVLLWRSKINLTAADTPEAVAGHVLDSLSLLAVGSLRRSSRVIDVGSGAGFPGLPVKIARPDLAVTLLDASRRRVSFLEHLRRELDIDDLQVVLGRAEDLGHDKTAREQFDYAVERAAAKAPAAAELCLPLVKVGGAAILLKGSSAREEIVGAARLIAALGSRSGDEVLSPVLVAGRHRIVAVLPKEHPSAQWLPRRARQLGRSPDGREPH